MVRPEIEMRCLLLQVRDRLDAMGVHEVECFARALGIPPEAIRVLDLLEEGLDRGAIAGADLVLLGGSGAYSATGEEPWLDRALDSLRRLHASAKPTFASCWGFQAMARAMGGRVVHDPARAEVGTHRLRLTEEGRRDPVFGPLGRSFLGQMGHEDVVVELPPGASLLASSDKVANQAYRFDDVPIYCTQFHPELRRSDLVLRLSNYPRYVERLAGIAPDRVLGTIEETPGAEGLLPRFVGLFAGYGAS